MWLYLPDSAVEERPRIHLLICYSVFFFTKALRLVSIIHRSFTFQGGSAARVQNLEGAVEIRIRPARALKFRAGEYVYLSLAGLSWLSFLSVLELHPFQIMWSYNDQQGKQILVVLARVRRGFTRRLLTSQPMERRALLEGPYGRPLKIRQYGTVLLMATGIGIAGQLPYIKELLSVTIDLTW